MLITSAPLEGFAHWREVNRWADHLPFVLFAEPDDARALARSHGALPRATYGMPARNVPSVCVNAPAAALPALRALRDVKHVKPSAARTPSQAAFELYTQAISTVTPHLGPAPWWWLHAECDDGVGAIVVAATSRNACVALAERDMGALGAAWAAKLNVDASVHDVTAIQ